MLVAVATVAEALAAWVSVIVTVLVVLWNKLDKRFDEPKADMQENRAETRALREALLSIKA